MNRQLRARVLLEEARALGLDLDDLVSAATGEARPCTRLRMLALYTSSFTTSAG